jgi:uncharacterized membrane protein
MLNVSPGKSPNLLTKLWVFFCALKWIQLSYPSKTRLNDLLVDLFLVWLVGSLLGGYLLSHRRPTFYQLATFDVPVACIHMQILLQSS